MNKHKKAYLIHEFAKLITARFQMMSSDDIIDLLGALNQELKKDQDF